MTQKKVFILIGILLIVGISTGTIYTINNRRQGTSNTILQSNQLTYKDADYSFQYPNTWESSSGAVFNPQSEIMKGDTKTYAELLSFVKIPTKDYYKDYLNNHFDINEFTELTINSARGESFFNPHGEAPQGWYLALSDGDTILIFGPTKTDITKNETLYSIIKTVKFN